VNKCIIKRQFRDVTIFFAQDQYFSKIHKTDKKIFLAKTKKFNDKPNCQVPRILMNPRPSYLKCSENDSRFKLWGVCDKLFMEIRLKTVWVD
jgi:hypothetical protein